MNLLALTLSALLGATAPQALPESGAVGNDPAQSALQETGGPAVIAQEREEQRPAPRRKMRVIRLEELKIEGRIQKPQAFYLLQRSSLNFDDLNRQETFLDKVVEAVEKPPF
ncbi:MAG TPA: hypothetical protein VK013_12560 [Myxococcaceae bacterium]|nr:hypothetical protein [Myxococcaceae bacterium]